MNTTYIFLAAKRYWNDEEDLDASFNELKTSILKGNTSAFLITDEVELNRISLAQKDILVAVPMSGAVQSLLLKASENFKATVIFAAYVKGNASDELCSKMMFKNAAPTVMDTWSVIRRNNNALLALSKKDLEIDLKVMEAFVFVKTAKLILVGETEPWVVSVSRKIEEYEKLGLKIEKVSQDEIRERYTSSKEENGAKYYGYFKTKAKKTVEPTEKDIKDSCRMAYAIVETLKAHKAQGMALACFNLLSTGTNSCLGVSFINGNTPYIAACEGDLDSAVTMLMMKKLTNTNLWMANPGIHPNGLINFSHCTAPISITKDKPCDYILRNHHESNIGTSLQVELPMNSRVTACRMSGVTKEVTVQNGEIVDGEYEKACRTQAYVKFDDFDKYIDTALGCHQVFAFEDISDEMKKLSKLLNFKVI